MESSVPEFGDTRAALHAAHTAAAAAPEAPTATVAAPAAPTAPEPAAPALEAPAPFAVPAEGLPLIPAPAPAVAAPAPQPAPVAQPQPVAPAPQPEPTVASLLSEIQSLKALIPGAVAAPGAQPAPAPEPAPEPLPAPPSDQEIHVYAQQQAQFVPEIPEVVAEYRTALAEIGREDNRGNWVPGTLGVVLSRGGYAVPELDSTIRTLQIQLDPEKAKAHRLPPIDELSRADYQQSLKDLQLERRDRIDTFRNQRERAGYLADRYQRVYDHFRGQATQGYQQEIDRREYNTALDTLAVSIRSTWESEFGRVLTEMKVDPADKDLSQRLWDQVEVRGRLASNEEVAPERLNSWLKSVVTGELGWVDKYHRLQSRVYGNGKLQDAGAAIAAPGAPGAPAPAAPSTVSYEEQRDANKLRLRGSWGQRRRA